MNARRLSVSGSRASTSACTVIPVTLPHDPAPMRRRRPRIVPVFLPHAGCPHRCVFCNQHTITQQQAGGPLPDPRTVVTQWLGRRPQDPANVQLAFYGGNFLGLAQEPLASLLDATRRLVAEGWIGALRFSTRPDTVDGQRLALLAGMPVAAVELGVQSMDDTVLAASRRGHTAAQTEIASELLKAAGYKVGMQMMIGLPGQGPSSALATGARIVRLAADFVRIYPCLVLADTPLAVSYRSGLYHPLTLDCAVDLTQRLWRLFARRGIPVIRMGLQASPELDPERGLVAGPYHPAFGHLVRSAVYFDALADKLEKMPLAGRVICIATHPDRIACVRGQANGNIQKLAARFSPAEIRVTADSRLPLECLNLQISDL